MIPSHEILKLNKAEPSVAGAVVPEHKNTILLKEALKKGKIGKMVKFRTGS